MIGRIMLEKVEYCTAMKKTCLIIVFLIAHSYSWSQLDLSIDDDGHINFSEVIYTQHELSASQIYENFNEWVLTNSAEFRRSNSEKNFQGTEVWLTSTRKNFALVDALFQNDDPLKLSDKESLKLIARIINKYTGSEMGCLRIIYLEYNLIIHIKDSKYKYEITDFTYTHYNQATAKQSQIYGMKDEGPCKSKGNLKELQECERCQGEFRKLDAYLKNDINQFLIEMKKEIDIKAEDDDW